VLRALLHLARAGPINKEQDMKISYSFMYIFDQYINEFFDELAFFLKDELAFLVVCSFIDRLP